MPDFKESLHRYMQELTPADPPAFDTVRARARRRAHRHVVALAVGAVALVVGIGAVAGTVIDRHRSPASATATAPGPSSTTTLAQVPGRSRTGAVPFGGSSASCVAGYSLHALRARAFAFDGTVVGVGPLRTHGAGSSGPPGYVEVRFKVNEWFRGGRAAHVTVAVFPAATQHDNAEDWNALRGASYGVGSRLLVTGAPRWGDHPLNDPVAWSCGFTRYFDPRTAAAWRHAFAVNAKSSGGSH